MWMTLLACAPMDGWTLPSGKPHGDDPEEDAGEARDDEGSAC